MRSITQSEKWLNSWESASQQLTLGKKTGKSSVLGRPDTPAVFIKSEVNRLLGKEIPAEHASKENTRVIYARVSESKQKETGNLERQIERLVDYAVLHGYRIAEIFEETASGLNENRKKLHIMLRMAESGEFSVLIVEFKDRLTRFSLQIPGRLPVTPRCQNRSGREKKS